MEYLQHLEATEEIKSTIVLDGRKVRLGFEGNKLDPFDEKYAEQGEQLRDMAKVLDDKQVEAVFEVSLTLNQKLDGMLNSEDPLIVEIFKGLNMVASLKFHNKQFKRILETTTDKKWEDQFEKKEVEEN